MIRALSLAVALLFSPLAWADGTCVDVTANGARSYGCLNDSLAHMADHAHGPVPPQTLTATSPANAVGSYNAAAAAEHQASVNYHREHPGLSGPRGVPPLLLLQPRH